MNYHIKSELNAINTAVRENKDTKVVNNGKNITVVGVDEVAPAFTRMAEVNVKTGAVDFGVEEGLDGVDLDAN